MTLTIPKAGVSGGAVAAPQFEAPEIGGQIAQFGQKVLQAGLLMKQQQDQRSLAKARVDMMTGLNDLSLELDQVGDPDQIEADYGARSTALRDTILGGLPESVREQAGLAFDEMNVPHAARQGQRVVGLRQSTEMATLMQAGDQLVRAAAIGDAATREGYLGQFGDHLDTLVQRGVLQPDEAERQRQMFGGRMDAARATRLLSDDPQALVDAIDAGEFATMDGPALEGWRARGVSGAASLAARVQAEADRARDEQISAAGDLLSDGIAVLRTGQPFGLAGQAADLLADPDIAALPEAREYAATVMLTEQRPGIAVMPLPQKQALLAELEGRPIEKPYEADQIEALRKMIDEDKKRFAEDPLGRAAEIGFTPAPDLPDPATAAVSGLVAGLRGRAGYAGYLVKKGYVGPESERLFTPEERDLWERATAADAPPDQRARVAAAMGGALSPRQAARAAAEIGADPVFTYVSAGLSAGLPAQLGRQIFEGQRVIAGKQVKLPQVADRREAYFGEFSSLFPDGTVDGWPDQSGARDQITAAADALYAYRMRGKVAEGEGKDGMIQETDYLQAVHEVMGGTGKYDGSFMAAPARGGIQKVNGQLTMMPPGVAAAEVVDRLHALAGWIAQPEMNDKVWAQLSAGSNLPDLGGERPTAYSLSRIGLRAIDQDRYVMTWPNLNTGELTLVMGDDGAPFVLSMTALLSGGVSP